MYRPIDIYFAIDLGSQFPIYQITIDTLVQKKIYPRYLDTYFSFKGGFNPPSVFWISHLVRNQQTNNLPSLVVFPAEAVARSFVPMELGRSVVLRDRCRRMRCQGVLGAWPRGGRVGMGCPIGRWRKWSDQGWVRINGLFDLPRNGVYWCILGL